MKFLTNSSTNLKHFLGEHCGVKSWFEQTEVILQSEDFETRVNITMYITQEGAVEKCLELQDAFLPEDIGVVYNVSYC